MTWQKREREPHPRKGLGQPPPKTTTMCPPLPEAPPKPKSNTSPTPRREDTPWPSAGKMLGNLFQDRNWLLPKYYLVAESKEDTNAVSARPPLKEESKMEEQATSLKAEKHGWGPDCPFCKAQKKKKKLNISRSCHQIYQSLKLKDLMP